MTTYDTEFVALGGGDPSADIGFYTTGENNIRVGALFYGYHIGAQGSATTQIPAGGANFGIVGTVVGGPKWQDGGAIGVYGTSNFGPGVAGTSSSHAGVLGRSSFDAGVLGQNGDVYAISGAAGVSAARNTIPASAGRHRSATA